MCSYILGQALLNKISLKNIQKPSSLQYTSLTLHPASCLSSAYTFNVLIRLSALTVVPPSAISFTFSSSQLARTVCFLGDSGVTTSTYSNNSYPELAIEKAVVTRWHQTMCQGLLPRSSRPRVAIRIIQATPR